ncbi:signal transduction histidine kinase [Pseudarthrobacter oxydans]|uniref:Oxygen sensor histidine kinase NreB n=1 Tax=Pseudarthrobacter oxydans TaxID=1671 RepID=A0AAW8NBI3_PSEOX|nr:sensor histidine kinase [Pseudarthrobacter oxydans]MDR6792743.1 signal transduction histidine kinase [Pseudarthrobacter oxydans]MDR7163999.1 signal transduction histidine kinase [Pseudarthrobacter oxydans]
MPTRAAGTAPATAAAPGTTPRRSAPRTGLGSIETAVHLGFAVLLVASLVRYVMRHSPADNLVILGLAAAASLLYAAVAVLGWRGGPGAPWMFALVAVWAVLVIAAPSFAWCSFALFFLSRSALAGAASYAAAGITAAATAAGLFRMSNGTDLAMLLGPLAVGAMLTLIYDRIQHDAEEQRRLHAEVSAAQEQLAASERRAGTIAERERVSREIHDTVTQGLASSLLLLEAAGRAWPRDAARADLRRATALLRGNLSETRSLVHELASPGLDGSPLSEALLLAARQYVPEARLLVTGDPRPVPPELRHALLRVVQSAASNIKLHASATAATVTLGFLPEGVTLDVYDDGTGFDPAAAAPPSDAGGYGLRAMRQRVEQLGGTLSVESSPGEGTIVAAQLPLPSAIQFTSGEPA